MGEKAAVRRLTVRLARPAIRQEFKRNGMKKKITFTTLNLKIALQRDAIGNKLN